MAWNPLIRTLVAGFTLAIAVSAPAFASGSTKTISDVHAVAVIVAMGSQAEYQSLGVTVFNNEMGKIDIADWGLDDLITGDITELLKDRYIVRAADYDHDAYATTTRRFLDREVPVCDLIMSRNDRALVDAYVVVYPDEQLDPILRSNAHLQGLGLYRNIYGLSHVVADYAFYTVRVVDSATCGTIAAAPLNFGQVQPLSLVLSWKVTAGANAPASPADMTDAQRRAFHGRATALLEQALEPTLAGLGLLPGGPVRASKKLNGNLLDTTGQ